jgi:hypothetical protein
VTCVWPCGVSDHGSPAGGTLMAWGHTDGVGSRHTVAVGHTCLALLLEGVAWQAVGGGSVLTVVVVAWVVMAVTTAWVAMVAVAMVAVVAA